jgi:hypothetical protein
MGEIDQYWAGRDGDAAAGDRVLLVDAGSGSERELEAQDRDAARQGRDSGRPDRDAANARRARHPEPDEGEREG